MCGIAGSLSPHPISQEYGSQLGLNLANAMSLRGPDAQRAQVEPESGLVFAHARLSVIDLSESANQPFVAQDGAAMLVFNGEVYNFAALRGELIRRGHVFRTMSDTEVVLEACREWGVAGAVKQFVGMFAFAFWDAHERCLTLARDPLGIKPLFYGNLGDSFAFASTLTALAQHPDFSPEISPAALSAFFTHAYVPSPYSIFEGIQKLPAGHLLTVRASGERVLDCYWDAFSVAQNGLAAPFTSSDTEIVDGFDALLRDSVRGCLTSDVPLGAFLSGGIDSSLVVALMSAEGSSAPRTFTIGFDDKRFDESTYAADVARHLGCDHTQMNCSAKDAQALIPYLASSYDEPFADSSQIPTLLLSKLTRSEVTVALSGDGGDELFCGYDRYFWMERLDQFGRSSHTYRQALRRLLALVPGPKLNALLSRLPFSSQTVPALDTLQHLARMDARANDFGYLYKTNPMSVCNYLDVGLLKSAQESKSLLDDESIRGAFSEVIPWMQFIDMQTYLPDDILQKVDRASMAYSLEARVPLLDHRLVEFAWRVPAHLKLRHGRGKVLMRELLKRHLPDSLIERPKQGFSVPLSDWLMGDLREWAEAQISSAEADPLLDPDGVRSTWRNFLTGRAGHTQTTVWSLLMYAQWRSQFSHMSGPRPGAGHR